MPTTPTTGTTRRRHIEVLFSEKASPRKYHLSADCTALDRLRELGYDPAEKLARTTFTRRADVAEDPEGRPCRNCALEQTLVPLLRRRGEEPMTFVSVSAQKSPGEAFTRLGRRRADYAFDTCTESAAARLLRIGARTGLHVTHATVGPVLYGFVPTRAVDAVVRNLRAIVRPEVTALPKEEAVSVVWGMYGADPPEIRAVLAARGHQVPDVVEPWIVADLIFAEAA